MESGTDNIEIENVPGKSDNSICQNLSQDTKGSTQDTGEPTCQIMSASLGNREYTGHETRVKERVGRGNLDVHKTSTIK